MVLLGVGVEDMIEIDEITDKAIAENLFRRLKSEIIYVRLSSFFSPYFLGGDSDIFSKGLGTGQIYISYDIHVFSKSK